MDELTERISMELQQERGRLSLPQEGDLLFEPVKGVYQAQEGEIEAIDYVVIHQDITYRVIGLEQEHSSKRFLDDLEEQLQQLGRVEQVSSFGSRYLQIVDSQRGLTQIASPDIEEAISQSEEQYDRLYQNLEEAVESGKYRSAANILVQLKELAYRELQQGFLFRADTLAEGIAPWQKIVVDYYIETVRSESMAMISTLKQSKHLPDDFREAKAAIDRSGELWGYVATILPEQRQALESVAYEVFPQVGLALAEVLLHYFKREQHYLEKELQKPARASLARLRGKSRARRARGLLDLYSEMHEWIPEEYKSPLKMILKENADRCPGA